MKYSKYILEAINRGIRLALDDIDINDIETPISAKNDIIFNDNDLFMNYVLNVVDLGLPSGTLWSKYNLGVNPRKDLDTRDKWYGGYYAWGETHPNKKDYSLKTYKFAIIPDPIDRLTDETNYDWTYFTKYTSSELGGNVYNNDYDELTHLLNEDDAAFINMKMRDYKFHIPTVELFKELIKYTKLETVFNYNGISNLYGKLFTSKKNGRSIFFPAAAEKYNNFDSSKLDSGKHMVVYGDGRPYYNYGLYWTSDLIDNTTRQDWDKSCKYAEAFIFAIDLQKHNEYIKTMNYERIKGLRIRPVIKL